MITFKANEEITTSSKFLVRSTNSPALYLQMKVHGQMYFNENENFGPSVARMQAVNLPDTSLARRIMQQITREATELILGGSPSDGNLRSFIVPQQR